MPPRPATPDFTPRHDWQQAEALFARQEADAL